MSSRLDEIKARAAAATGGPWKWDNRRVPTLNRMAGSRDVYRYGRRKVIEADHTGESRLPKRMSTRSNCWPGRREFIAHARTDVPVLVAAVIEAAMYAPREVGHDLYRSASTTRTATTPH